MTKWQPLEETVYTQNGRGLRQEGTGFGHKSAGLGEKGTGFSQKSVGVGEKGTGFSPYIEQSKLKGALAPEGHLFKAGHLSIPVLCLVFLFALKASAQTYLDCNFVPGWQQSGPTRQYTPDNLFEYRDGAAEGYLIFSFARMQGIDCKSGAITLSIDISDMTDADSAYGMFAANRDPQQPIANVGMGAQLLSQSLLFAKGKYFVEIIETDGSTDTNQSAALQAFAAKIEPLLEGRSTPPEELAWFPPENQESAKLVPESVLGLKILKRGYVAKYKVGQAFIVIEKSPDSAAEVMKKLRDHFESSTAAKLADESFQVEAPYLEGVCIFRKGRIIAGYANLPNPAEATARSAKLMERIP